MSAGLPATARKPPACTCLGPGGGVRYVPDLAGTLHCPMAWEVTPDGCFHTVPARKQAPARRKAAA